MKPKILHFTFDYSKINDGKSTVVVSDLIKATSEYSVPLICSLKRTLNPFKENIRFYDVDTLEYDAFGFPSGLFLSSNMKRMTNKIIKKLKLNVRFQNIDLIHAHKLTFEGFIGYHFSKAYHKHLILSIRQTDFLVLKYRPDLIPLCRRILKFSSVIFYIAPYMKELLKEVIGAKFYSNYVESKLSYLPNVVEIKKNSKKNQILNKRFLTILWLNKKAISRKNLYRLFEAISKLKNENVKLDVIGQGDYEGNVRLWAKKLGIERNIRFLGFVKNDNIPEYLSSYLAFLMPSHSETFGVVYAESLLSGTPILYTKGTGFDGVFDNVGVAVNSESTESITAGIEDLIDNNEIYRKEIRKLKENGALSIFSRQSVGGIYEKCIKNTLNIDGKV